MYDGNYPMLIYICMSDVTIISYVSKYYSYNLQLRGVNGSNLVKLRLSTVYHYYLMFLIIFLLISEHLHLMFYVLPLILIMIDERACDWPKRFIKEYPLNNYILIENLHCCHAQSHFFLSSLS